MWHTPEGDRVLRGAEANLLKASVTAMVELIREEASGYEKQWKYGVGLFDQLLWSQRLALLEHVATYLFTDTSRPAELTGVNEAAIGALFEHIQGEIDLEIEAQADAGPAAPLAAWRELVVAAYAECFPDDIPEAAEEDEFSRPDVTCDDVEDWRALVEVMADRILWDRDFEMEDMFLDAPPEKNNMLRQYLGIEPDYFVAAAPDVATEQDVQQLYRRLEVLTHGNS